MAFSSVNSIFGVPLLQRGKPLNLGTISASTAGVTFAIPGGKDTPNGFDTLVIITTGNLVATVPILEASFDGTSWFAFTAPTSASSVPVLNVTTVTGDTAATTVQTYSVVQGLTYRFAFNTVTSGSGACWLYIA